MTRPSFVQRVAQFFREHPNQWIDGLAFATIGGAYASRSRISECRTRLGMAIENRQFKRWSHVRGEYYVVSEYRYTPPSPSSAVSTCPAETLMRPSVPNGGDSGNREPTQQDLQMAFDRICRNFPEEPKPEDFCAKANDGQFAATAVPRQPPESQS